MKRIRWIVGIIIICLLVRIIYVNVIYPKTKVLWVNQGEVVHLENVDVCVEKCEKNGLSFVVYVDYSNHSDKDAVVNFTKPAIVVGVASNHYSPYETAKRNQLDPRKMGIVLKPNEQKSIELCFSISDSNFTQNELQHLEKFSVVLQMSEFGYLYNIRL